jgi:DNA polymerase-1
MMGCSIGEAAEFIQEYFIGFPVLKRWINAKVAEAKRTGYVLNLFGRKRPIPEIQDAQWSIRAKGEREAVNTIVQGTAVDIVKKMQMILRCEILDAEVRIVLQVHDEILMEVPDAFVGRTLERLKDLVGYFPDYPCTVKVGKSYGDLHKEEEYVPVI